MSTFSPKAHLKDNFQFVQGLLVRDLNAVVADKANASPGGVARPALVLVVECAAVNSLVATRLETGAFPERRSPEEREAFFASFDTVDKALAFLEQETTRLIRAIDAYDETKWGEPGTGILGNETTMFGLVEFTALHMMYHDGQLNYIHALHGDTEMHW